MGRPNVSTFHSRKKTWMLGIKPGKTIRNSFRFF